MKDTPKRNFPSRPTAWKLRPLRRNVPTPPRTVMPTRSPSLTPSASPTILPSCTIAPACVVHIAPMHRLKFTWPMTCVLKPTGLSSTKPKVKAFFSGPLPPAQSTFMLSSHDPLASNTSSVTTVQSRPSMAVAFLPPSLIETLLRPSQKVKQDPSVISLLGKWRASDLSSAPSSMALSFSSIFSALVSASPPPQGGFWPTSPFL
mmetsp:Transcript_25372/g.56129  ORF Transcript_25372/g.56129 Transcript_25372/m.56129 type:complete len:204 (-) Transcript_25372:118-729(-)